MSPVKQPGDAANAEPESENPASGILRTAWTNFRRSFKSCDSRLNRKSVHQLRIQTRRLRAAIRLMRPFSGKDAASVSRRRLKRLLRKLAPLRDTQVQLLQVKKRAKGIAGHGRLLRSLKKSERRLSKRLTKRMGRIELAPFQREFNAVLRSTERFEKKERSTKKCSEALVHELRSAFLKVLRRSRARDTGTTAGIHRVRVAFKEFRYMAELLQSLLPEYNDAMIEKMREFQTKLGEIQDATVMIQTLPSPAKGDARSEEATLTWRNQLERKRLAQVKWFLAQKVQLADFKPHPPPEKAKRRFNSR